METGAMSPRRALTIALKAVLDQEIETGRLIVSPGANPPKVEQALLAAQIAMAMVDHLPPGWRVEEYIHVEPDGLLVAFAEWRRSADLLADTRKCADCGWMPGEGRHTIPCRDGEDCASPDLHHPFREAV